MHLIQIALLLLAQAVLTDDGPAPPPGDLDVRHASLPGAIDGKLMRIEGLRCTSFHAYTEMQTFLNLLQGDESCSGEVLNNKTGAFRQLNILDVADAPLKLVIHSPTGESQEHSKIIVFLTGGPRTLAITRPLISNMVGLGYTVVVPIYLGQVDTLHPDADLPVAVKQTIAVNNWAGSRLKAIIGVSTGAYLAAASCKNRCPVRVLLAPPLSSPEDSLSDKRVDWSKLKNGYCLWRMNGTSRICADDKTYIRSFWGDYYKTSIATLLSSQQCKNVNILVSSSDTRIYDPQGVKQLRKVGCSVDVIKNLQHDQMDQDSNISRQVADIVSRGQVVR